MSEHTEDSPVPEGRHVTNKQMAEFVAERIDAAAEKLRDDQKRLRVEVRGWLISFAAIYQFHLNLGFFAAPALGYFAWTRFFNNR